MFVCLYERKIGIHVKVHVQVVVDMCKIKVRAS